MQRRGRVRNTLVWNVPRQRLEPPDRATRLSREASRGFVLDLVIPLVAFLRIFTVSVGTSARGPTLGDVVGMVLAVGDVILAFTHFARGQTPGRRLLGTRVIREDGRHAGFFTLLVREWIGRPISGMAGGSAMPSSSSIPVARAGTTSR